MVIWEVKSQPREGAGHGHGPNCAAALQALARYWRIGPGVGLGSSLPSSKKKNLSFDSFVLGLSSWEGSCALGRVWKPLRERHEDWGFRVAPWLPVPG